MEDIPAIDLSDYEIIRPIGEGAYGRVYLIEHKVTKKQYAAKETFKEYKSEDKKQAFNKEILAYSKAHGPAILTIHGYSLTNFQGFSYPVIISEYMEKSSLEKYLNNEDSSIFSLTPQQKYKILLGITLGMKTLHSQRIIHRDLKPGNILLDSDFSPHICDFGISYISDLSASQILMNSVVGTIMYQAPEILLDEPYTNKVDVFSFSLIAYQLITGSEPFKFKKTPFQIQFDITRGIRPDLKCIEDPEIKDFLELAWSEVPDKRPSFDLIVEEILSEKYQNFFNVTDEEIDDYLNQFDESIRNRFSVSKLLNSFRKKDDADSLFQLASMYDQGESGIEVDKKQANEYYRKACEKGSSDAMLIYCRKLLKGDGIPENKEEAAQIYKKFADNGNAKAMNNYGLMLYYGNGIEMNKELAADYLKKSADNGNPNAMFMYSKMLYEGDGVEMDKEMAAEYYKSAADQGNSKAMLSYTEMCLNGDGIKKNKKEAIKYYELFASKGDPKASLNLAIMLLLGNGIPKNKKMAAFYMKNAAELGEADAMFNYGVMSFLGDGIKEDKKEGVKYIQMAIDQGNENAQKFYNEKIARKDDDDTKIIDDSNDADDVEFANPDLSNFKINFKRIVCPLFLDVCLSEEINRIRKDEKDEADLFFYDGSLTAEKYLHYNPNIHLNKIPGICDFCCNTFLFKNLKDMKSKHPSIYQQVFPNTFILPDEEEEFINAIKEPEYGTIPWILKNNRKGKTGVTFVQNPNEFMIPTYRSIIQPFVTPYLIDDHKFDIRVYVMITKVKPFTVFIYNDCFAYFCSEPFSGSPTPENRNSYVFLKNGEINTDFNSIRSARKIVQDIAYNDNSLWNKIKRISALVVLSIYKSIHEKVKEVCKVNDAEFDDKDKIDVFHRFFNLLGIDFLINEDGDPLVIGLNDNPGMKPFNNFDKQTKSELIKNEYKLMAAIIQNSKAKVKNWTKIIPSDDHNIKSVVTDIMKGVDDKKKKRSFHRIPSVTYVANDDDDE